MKKIIMMSCIFLLAISANAGEFETTVVLPIKGEFLKTQIFNLKKLIKTQNPTFNLKNATLDKVIVRLKTKSETKVTLVTNFNLETISVFGNQGDYRRLGSYKSIIFYGSNDVIDQKSIWRLILQPTYAVKVKDIKAVLTITTEGEVTATCQYIHQTRYNIEIDRLTRAASAGTLEKAKKKACKVAKTACESRIRNSYFEKCEINPFFN